MNANEVVGESAEVITIFAEAEDWGRRRGKKAGESPASTRDASTQADSTKGNSAQAEKLTPKQLGEIAEAEFIAKAVGLGFVVAKPWGDSEPYDFIVNPKKSFIFWRVMPVRVVEELKSLKLYPGSRKQRSRFEQWREAWEVLRRAVRRARRK